MHNERRIRRMVGALTMGLKVSPKSSLGIRENLLKLNVL